MILVQTPSGVHNRDFMNSLCHIVGGLVASYLMKGLTKLWKIHINIMKLEEGKSFLIHQIHQFFS